MKLFKLSLVAALAAISACAPGGGGADAGPDLFCQAQCANDIECQVTFQGFALEKPCTAAADCDAATEACVETIDGTGACIVAGEGDVCSAGGLASVTAPLLGGGTASVCVNNEDQCADGICEGPLVDSSACAEDGDCPADFYTCAE